MVKLAAKYRIWITAAVVAHTLWTSAAPAMVYPIYIEQWDLTYTQTMLVFGTYPIVVGTMLLFGNFATRLVTRHQLISLGLSASVFGVFLFAIGDSLIWLLIGRISMGIGVGLSAGYSAAELIELVTDKQRAGTIAITAQSVGFSASFIVGGAFVEFSTQPTYYPFIFLFFILLAVLASYIFSARTSSQEHEAHSDTHQPNISRPLFGILTLAVTTAYAHGVIYTALGAAIAKQLLASPNNLLNGLVLGFFAFSIGAGALFARKLNGFPALRIGAIFSICGMALLGLAVNHQSILFYGLSSLSSGIGYALKVSGSIFVINKESESKNSSKTINKILVFAYFFTGIFSIILGNIAEKFQILFTTYISILSISLMCIFIIYLSPRNKELTTSR